MSTTLYGGAQKLSVDRNRKKFLKVLRSGKYKKGIATSDKKTGRPIVKLEGYCVCAVMVHEFGGMEKGTGAYKIARDALGINGKDCSYIQTQLNDTKLTFPQIADRIENEIFKL